MSEIIIKSLMQLFAIIAKVDSENAQGRRVVEAYLKNQLNAELVAEYLELFDQFVEVFHNISDKKEGAKKKISNNSVKILRICNQINSELTQKQKIVVIVRLLELIHSDENVTQQEIDFVDVVADSFLIDMAEFKDLSNFIMDRESELLDHENYIYIDPSNKIEKYSKSQNEFFEGKIMFFRIPSVNIIILKLKGHEDLYLNGQIINRNSIYFFNQGSSLRSSKLTPIYHSDILSQFLKDIDAAQINFEVKNILFRFGKEKIGIHNLSLKEEGGNLIGIMGGSGAGKTTLLNVLCGIYHVSEGEILINGYNINTQKEAIEGVIGYISQDDLLLEDLSVFENLYYNAKLCFQHLSERAILRKVAATLKAVGLYHIKDLKVGNPINKKISGGQRKRLNIALELIREPSVLFVDEPTSGLSSRDSENIMDLLKELSLKGKMIFVVIHQPSSDIFKMFDKLIIMDTGGYLIYYGNPVDSVLHFKKMINHVSSRESECPACGNVNPEQIFNIIESKVIDQYGNLTDTRRISPIEWNNIYIRLTENNPPIELHQTELPENEFKVPGLLKQIKLFTIRDVLTKISNVQYLTLNFLEAPALGFILSYLVRFYNSDISNTLGYFYRENQNLPAFMFMAVVVALFLGMTVSAEEIIRDQRILKREQFLNLSRFSYLTSKVIIMFALSAIQMLGFVLVGNTVLDIKSMTFDYWLVLFSTACFANLVGLNISSTFNSVVTIYIVIPLMLIPQMLLSGVIVKFEKLNPTLSSNTEVPISGEIIASRWAFEALAVNQFKSNKFEKQFYALDMDLAKAEFNKNHWIPKLKAKVENIERNLVKTDQTAKDEIKSDLLLIVNELKEFEKSNPNKAFKGIEELTIEKLFTPAGRTIIEGMKNYFDDLKSYYIKFYNKVSDAKDRMIVEMTNSDEKKANFIQLKNNYNNESLEEMVKNSKELIQIVEVDHQLIQRKDPIFLLPPKDRFLRAHFYAPYKSIFGRYVDTFVINIVVIWFMTLLLYITLYFDFFKGILNISEKIKLRNKK